jgi:hypothetical protein
VHHFRLHTLHLDITDSYTNQLIQVIQGNLQSVSWTAQSSTFNLPATSRGQDTIYRITTVLSADIAQTGLNVFESELFAADWFDWIT